MSLMVSGALFGGYLSTVLVALFETQQDSRQKKI
jgi:hypothetical protein